MTVSISPSLALAHRFISDFLGQENPQAADEMLDEAVEVTSSLLPQGPICGREAYKSAVAAVWAAFAGIEPLRILDIFESADGEKVVARFTSKGRHARRFSGIEPTGQEISFDQVYILRFTDGRIVEIVDATINSGFTLLIDQVLRPRILK